ncbi:MAG: hypothetical protein ACYCPT_06995 [Acidimicrobiales bacterium]
MNNHFFIYMKMSANTIRNDPFILPDELLIKIFAYNMFPYERYICHQFFVLSYDKKLQKCRRERAEYCFSSIPNYKNCVSYLFNKFSINDIIGILEYNYLSDRYNNEIANSIFYNGHLRDIINILRITHTSNNNAALLGAQYDNWTILRWAVSMPHKHIDYTQKNWCKAYRFTDTSAITNHKKIIHHCHNRKTAELFVALFPELKEELEKNKRFALYNACATNDASIITKYIKNNDASITKTFYKIFHYVALGVCSQSVIETVIDNIIQTHYIYISNLLNKHKDYSNLCLIKYIHKKPECSDDIKNIIVSDSIKTANLEIFKMFYDRIKWTDYFTQLILEWKFVDAWHFIAKRAMPSCAKCAVSELCFECFKIFSHKFVSDDDERCRFLITAKPDNIGQIVDLYPQKFAQRKIMDPAQDKIGFENRVFVQWALEQHWKIDLNYIYAETNDPFVRDYIDGVTLPCRVSNISQWDLCRLYKK